MGLRTTALLALTMGLAAAARPLAAEERMRLISPYFGFSQASFQDDIGSSYSLEAYSVGADLLGLEGRLDNFPWVGLGTSVFVRYDTAELNRTQVSGNASSGSITLSQASYHYTAGAPCVMLDLYPFPNAKPFEPFIEGRLEVYELADSTLAQPQLERYRPVIQVGLRSEPNETGYYWGARIYGAPRGYSGNFDGVAVPDTYLIGLQVDWIGLVL
jgi:hypothetical protein